MLKINLINDVLTFECDDEKFECIDKPLFTGDGNAINVVFNHKGFVITKTFTFSEVEVNGTLYNSTNGVLSALKTLCEVFKKGGGVTPPTPPIDKGVGQLFLQGVTQSSGRMTNHFQQIGILPTTDPYGKGASYPDINNENGVCGKIVDWVLVEIWGNFAQTSGAGNEDFTDYDLLQSKALLLRTDGTMIDVNGKNPVFTGSGDVRVCVKHRNHLAGLTVLKNFSELNFDFSDINNIQEAMYEDSTQLIKHNGKYCLYGGDMNNDFYIDATDSSLFNIAKPSQVVNTYNKYDVNMNGVLDDSDSKMISTNTAKSVYSSITYFNKR